MTLLLRNLTAGLALLLMLAWIAPDPPTTYSLQPDSRLWVEGTSTIHDWSCDVSSVDGTLDAAVTETPQVTSVTVTVPAASLECKNGTMNKKATKALEVDDHPTITFELNTATTQPEAAEGDFKVQATGNLTIAGTTKKAELTAEGFRLEDGQLRFKGSYSMKMTDFDVDPPSAMLGTIKTGDEVTVHFDVVAAPASLGATTR